VPCVYTDIPNHEPACLMMNTGANQAGRPSMGAWLTYGLGTENQNLPGYVVLCPTVPTTVGPPLWSNGFLPAINQGQFISNRVQTPGENGEMDDMTPEEMPKEEEKAAKDKDGKDVKKEEKPKKVVVEKGFDPKKLVSYVNNPKFSLVQQRRELDLIEKLEKMREVQTGTMPKWKASSSRWNRHMQQAEAPGSSTFARNLRRRWYVWSGAVARGCLTAVRLAKRCAHDAVYYSRVPMGCARRYFRSKINEKFGSGFRRGGQDLKGQVCWKDTLVVCGSEFGRTPVREVGGGGAALKRGRDHNPFGFTMWLAGGAVKGGTIYGATDEFGFKAVEKPVHVHDIHATILYLFGIDHTKLTYRYSGRDFRLTDVSGNVLHDLIA
jgi:hypothetical protein